MPIVTIQEMEELSPLFKGKAGNAFARYLLRVTGAQKIIDLHERIYTGQSGPDFADEILKEIGIDYLIGHAERLASMVSGPFITISNHIYGHIDGIMLVDLIGHIRPEMKVMVNKILMYVKGLVPNFISVIPTGEKKTGATTESINGIKQSLLQIREGGPLCLFPSGAVSDLKLTGEPRIRDREWQDSVIKLIRKAEVPVIPIRFFDRNSWFYYSLGLIDYRIRLIRLCHEMFNKAGSTVRLAIGNPISVEKQNTFKDNPESFKAFLRSSVYDMELPDKKDFIPRSELSF